MISQTRVWSPKHIKNSLFQSRKTNKKTLNHQLTQFTKINSKWIKDLNICHDNIKVLQKNISKEISDIPHSNIFIDMSPRKRDIKETTNKWNLIKIKGFCMAKENISKMRRESTVWGNIFASETSDKGLIYKTYKNSHNFTPGWQTSQLKNWQRT